MACRGTNNFDRNLRSTAKKSPIGKLQKAENTKENAIIKRKPLVSVLLPTYNGLSRSIRQAVESVLQQDYENFELIIIDDGSTDETHRYIAENEDYRIRILRNRENLGIAYSLNKGLEIARGKYIARIDDDDYYCRSDKIARQVNFLEGNKEYVSVGCFVYDDFGNELKETTWPVDDENIRRKFPKSPICHAAMMFRKDVLEKANKFYESYPRCEDLELKMFLATKGKLFNIPEYLYVRRRIHEPHRTHGKSTFINVIRIMQKYRKHLGFRTLDFFHEYSYYIMACLSKRLAPNEFKPRFKRFITPLFNKLWGEDTL